MRIIALGVGIAAGVVVEEDAVSSHSFYREKYGMEAVKWNEAVGQNAELHAATLKSDCKLVYSGFDDRKDIGGHELLGENLWKCYGGAGCQGAGVQDAVDRWFEEVECYQWGAAGVNDTIVGCEAHATVGHFTQIMWDTAVEGNSQIGPLEDVGCAVVVCDSDDAAIVVCQYGPAANLAGQFAFDEEHAKLLDVDYPWVYEEVVEVSTVEPTDAEDDPTDAEDKSTENKTHEVTEAQTKTDGGSVSTTFDGTRDVIETTKDSGRATSGASYWVTLPMLLAPAALFFEL